MSLGERLKSLAQRIPTTIPLLETEEATKNALIMPFIAALGYDVFNPIEVIPEFTADVGTKKHEKVDYAIKRDGEIMMLVEAKCARDDLNEVHASQLYRYFSVTSARIAVLTNGVVYQFYSDLEEPNKMDAKPFFEVDMLSLRDDAIQELEKLTKPSFDLESMLSAANDLKNLREIRRFFEKQFEAPDEEFVKLCFVQANPTGRFMQSVREQFTALVKRALHQVLTERISARLRSALEKENGAAPGGVEPTQPLESDPPAEDDGIVTTEEELEGYHIVRAIVCSELAPSRVTWRDGRTYFSVLVDNNNRKPICRLWFNRSHKYVQLFADGKSLVKEPIEHPTELYRFSEALRATARTYLEPGAASVDAQPTRHLVAMPDA